MNIVTKYNVDEIVFVIIENKPVKVKITRIIIHVTKAKQEVWYELESFTYEYYKKPESKINI